tara:strand:+ start:1750 stop:2229 length:480 start_codon:yes stop_codon:yes gene_type:complete
MGGKKISPEQFLRYVTEHLSRDSVNLWVKVHNINHEKNELFSDFINSVYHLIKNTYLGDDVIKKEEDIKGHFNWCWTKTINNFTRENIFFDPVGKHKEYFWNLFKESFYTDIENSEKLKKFFLHLFTLHINKTKSELDMLLEMYVLLDKSLENKKLDTH